MQHRRLQRPGKRPAASLHHWAAWNAASSLQVRAQDTSDHTPHAAAGGPWHPGSPLAAPPATGADPRQRSMSSMYLVRLEAGRDCLVCLVAALVGAGVEVQAVRRVVLVQDVAYALPGLGRLSNPPLRLHRCAHGSALGAQVYARELARLRATGAALCICAARPWPHARCPAPSALEHAQLCRTPCKLRSSPERS